MAQKTMWLAGLAMMIVFAALGLAFAADGNAQAAQDATPTPLPEPELDEFDPDSVADIDLFEYPVVPEISEQAVDIYRRGVANGNDPHSFVKVGDCMTDHPSFLIPIGEGEYDLGDYEGLQAVIDHYSDAPEDPFARTSQAAAGGFNTASVDDSMWANPDVCESGETPLTCEFRIMQPSVALIMFGTNDAYYLDAATFDFYLRSIIVRTINNGTLPVLSTFPTRPEFPDKSVLYNQIVVQIALDYDIPLINLWRALDALPNQGVDLVETTHMTVPEDGHAAHFTDTNLTAGFTTRNLVTLQALDAVLQAVSAE